MAVSIRPARRADLQDVVRLWRELWDLHAALDPQITAAPNADRAMRELLTDHYEADDSCIFVAAEGETLLGYVLGTILSNPPVEPEPRFGYVSDLAVTASARSRGIGTRLLAEAHAWFRKAGLKRTEVQVSSLNARAASFWSGTATATFSSA